MDQKVSLPSWPARVALTLTWASLFLPLCLSLPHAFSFPQFHLSNSSAHQCLSAIRGSTSFCNDAESCHLLSASLLEVMFASLPTDLNTLTISQQELPYSLSHSTTCLIYSLLLSVEMGFKPVPLQGQSLLFSTCCAL